MRRGCQLLGREERELKGSTGFAVRGKGSMAERKVVRIANGQGFWGDSILGPVRLVKEGPLHYLALDYLA